MNHQIRTATLNFSLPGDREPPVRRPLSAVQRPKVEDVRVLQAGDGWPLQRPAALLLGRRQQGEMGRVVFARPNGQGGGNGFVRRRNRQIRGDDAPKRRRSRPDRQTQRLRVGRFVGDDEDDDDDEDVLHHQGLFLLRRRFRVRQGSRRQRHRMQRK